MSTKTIATAEQLARDILAKGKPTVPAVPGNESQDKLEHLGNRKVRVTYVWRSHEGAAKNVKTSVMDFSSVSQEQMIELALYAVKVKVQAILRSAANSQPGKPVDPQMLSTVDVLKDVIQAQSLKGDPVARAVAALRAAGADEETVKRLAEQLRKG